MLWLIIQYKVTLNISLKMIKIVKDHKKVNHISGLTFQQILHMPDSITNFNTAVNLMRLITYLTNGKVKIDYVEQDHANGISGLSLTHLVEFTEKGGKSWENIDDVILLGQIVGIFE